MDLSKISAGKNPPHDINVVIEIPSGSGAIKYEVDKDSGALMVDRFLGTSMVYPASYGFIPNTIAGDGDPADVLVLSPVAPVPGSVIRCRPLGMLRMTDDGGRDEKILAVPVGKLTPEFDALKSIDDVSPLVLKKIEHFFQHYKDLEEGKWVKLEGWAGLAETAEIIQQSISNFKK
jgi:inorganic pyrophosphatase